MFGWDRHGWGSKPRAETNGVWRDRALALLALGLVAGCASDPAASDPREGEGGSSSMMQPSMSGGSGSGTAGSKPGMGSAGSTPSSSGSAGMSAGMTAGATAPSTAGASAPGGMVDCSKLPLPTNADDVVSTFEDGMGNVNQTAGRGGGFYMFNDGTGMQMPPVGALPPARKETRCDSMFALCMSGKGFTVWGAGMGTDLGLKATADAGVGSKNPYDASVYKGISFWAKANAGSTTMVRVGFKDANTAPEGGKCDAMADNGPEACNDDWGKNLVLTTSWAPYTILWTDLKQAGWGKATAAYDTKNAYSIQFQVNKGLDFDLCIDDLAFVR